MAIIGHGLRVNELMENQNQFEYRFSSYFGVIRCQVVWKPSQNLPSIFQLLLVCVVRLVTRFLPTERVNVNAMIKVQLSHVHDFSSRGTKIK